MTDRLSSRDPSRQQPEPEERESIPLPPTLLSFDLHAEDTPDVLPGGPVGDDDAGSFDYDGDTVIDDRDEGDDDFDPPPANASAALVITAPKGPTPVRPGYTVAAVVLESDDDGEENVTNFQFLTPKKCKTLLVAVGLANYKALHPRRFTIPATHVVVNDETGREVHRRPVHAAA